MLQLKQGYVTDKTPFRELEFKAAKSSALYSIITREETQTCAAFQSMLHVYRQCGATFTEELLLEVRRFASKEWPSLLTLLAKYKCYRPLPWVGVTHRSAK